MGEDGKGVDEEVCYGEVEWRVDCSRRVKVRGWVVFCGGRCGKMVYCAGVIVGRMSDGWFGVQWRIWRFCRGFDGLARREGGESARNGGKVDAST